MNNVDNPHNCPSVRDIGRHAYDDDGFCQSCDHSVWKDCGCT